MSNELYLNDTKLNDPIKDLQDGIQDPTQSQEQSPPGFFSTLRNPIELMFEESLPASLYQWITGNTKKRQAEKALKFLQEFPQLQGSGQYNEALRIYKKYGYLLEEDTEHSFDAKELLNMAKKYPGVMGAELVNMLIADPYLLLLPSTVFSRLGRGIVNATRLNFSNKLIRLPARARNVIAGRAFQDIKSGAMASVLMPFAFTTGLQLGEKGNIDPNRTITETTFGATAGLLVSSVLGGISAVTQRSLLVPSKKINDIITKTINKDINSFFKFKEGKRFIISEIYDALKKEITGYNEEKIAVLAAQTEAANRILINNAEDSIKSLTLKAATFGGIGATAQFLTSEDEKLKESAYGFALGSGLYFGYKGLSKLLKHTNSLSNLELKFEAVADALQINSSKINGYAVHASNILKDNLPDPISRQKIFHYINQTKLDSNFNYSKTGKPLTLKNLSEKEIEGVQFVKNYFNKIDEIINVDLKDPTFKFTYRSNYIPIILNYSGNNMFDFTNQIYGSGTKTSKFFKPRAFDNINEALEAGYTIRNGMTDPVALIQNYTNAISKALGNKVLQKYLFNVKNGTYVPVGLKGTNIKLPMIFDPKENIRPFINLEDYYEKISHPLLGKNNTEYYIHKDIVKSFNMLFEAKSENEIMGALFNMNLMMKRSSVGYSFFHAGALLESQFFVGVDLKSIGEFVKPRSKNQIISLIDNPHLTLEGFYNADYALQKLEFNDLVSFARASRLQISTPEDVGYDKFYSILQDIDNKIFKPHLGIKPMEKVEKVYKWFDRITWNRIFTQAKLYTFLTQLNRTVQKGDDITSIYAKAKRAALFTNDAFGGQDWFGITQAISNKLMKRLTQTLFKPGSRGYMQLLMFAPDWTISNLRIISRAFPGFNNDPLARRAYQYYFLRAALYFGTIGTALNYIFSGHSQLENKDPTRIDLGNGDVLTFSKQLMEPFHWITDPQSTAIKKIGSLPKAVIEILTNKEYLTTKWSPNITSEDDSAIVKFQKIGGQVGAKFLPIWLQTSSKQIAERLEKDGGLSADLAIDVAVDFVLGQSGHPRYKGPRYTKYKLAGLVRSPYETLF